jgi:predicted phosphoribosyltransferase/predicted alpha/beta-hydrolase family hydrolase
MFEDREDAGRRLAELVGERSYRDPVVLGLPRGGVVVAAQVARLIGAPLDLVVVRKLGAPGNPELGIGAVAEDGAMVVNEALVARLRVGEGQLDRIANRERRELERRVAAYRTDPPVPLDGKTAIIVDDGLATGYTARAAVAAARLRGADRVVVAVPVAAPETAAEFEVLVDELLCVELPAMLLGVGGAYADFTQTTDDAVVSLLRGPAGEDVEIPCGEVFAEGVLTVPAGASGVVVFAHGSGSSRLSPRNRAVASGLNAAGLGTLLFDLLTPEEATDRRLVFDIPLLADRLSSAAAWLGGRVRGPMGFFGSSTGAAAALWAAAERDDVAAVVGRGGRPDLAEARLPAVRAPVRLIVGGDDAVVLELNEMARSRLSGVTDLAVIPGAGHLFEEAGALERVTDLAADWFVRWMADAV